MIRRETEFTIVKEFYELEECEIRERDLRGLRNAENKVHSRKQRFFTIIVGAKIFAYGVKNI